MELVPHKFINTCGKCGTRTHAPFNRCTVQQTAALPLCQSSKLQNTIFLKKFQVFLFGLFAVSILFAEVEGLEPPHPVTDEQFSRLSQYQLWTYTSLFLHPRRDSNSQPRLRIIGLEPTGHANERRHLVIFAGQVGHKPTTFAFGERCSIN